MRFRPARGAGHAPSGHPGPGRTPGRGTSVRRERPAGPPPQDGPTRPAPALARVRREHPAVAIDAGLADPDDALAEVYEGDADLALVVRPPADASRQGVRGVHLLDDPYRAVLPTGHPLAARRVLDLTDLAGEPWVRSEPPGPCLTPVTDACAAAGFSPDFAATSQEYATAQGFVAAGLGVSLVPLLGLSTRHPGVAVRRVRHPEPIRPIHAVVRSGSLDQPVLRTLLDALRESAGTGRPAKDGAARETRS
ncbi:LysR substrate-binding domain-containing protein [Streptomyces sp. NPDC053541]|uniref:LysR substrate-binding domain-containing protein n=1 Tax=Streptomyces sp. NPDC053541 TaxID=3365709 RepID=UPI0037CD0836